MPAVGGSIPLPRADHTCTGKVVEYQANLWGDAGKHPTLLEREEEEKSSLFLELPDIRAREAQIL